MRHRSHRPVGIAPVAFPSVSAVASPDPLAPVLALPGVAEAAEAAGSAIAEVHRHRANRRGFA
ncbi:MAG: hypothetical protein M3Y19_06660, partial [Actinomycetota bacterium]|nr:hypothetical protein [Actinomycetota bacterium]